MVQNVRMSDWPHPSPRIRELLRRGAEMDRDVLLRRFVQMQYVRNDVDFHRGTFRVRGDTVEIIPMY